jgi:protein ImuA
MVTRVLDGLGLYFEGRETVATGFSSLDRLLPAGGVRRGSLVEWLAGGAECLAGGDGSGAISLACAVACRLADPRWAEQSRAPQASTIVVVDRGQRFYPPAVIPWLDALADSTGKGGGRPHLVVARPSRDDDELWTIDQALRCPGVAAVLAWPKRVHATAMRRWQLASRASGAVGLLVRGLSECGFFGRVPAGEPTWADAKLAISPMAGESGADLAVRRLRISLAGGPWSGNEMLEERSTELLLDLTNGREATRRHRAPVRHTAPVVATSLQKGRFQPEGVACRAS